MSSAKSAIRAASRCWPHDRRCSRSRWPAAGTTAATCGKWSSFAGPKIGGSWRRSSTFAARCMASGRRLPTKSGSAIPTWSSCPKMPIRRANDIIELYLTRGVYSAFPIGFGYSLNGSSTVRREPVIARSVDLDLTNGVSLRSARAGWPITAHSRADSTLTPACTVALRRERRNFSKNLRACRKLLLTRSRHASNYPPLIYRQHFGWGFRAEGAALDFGPVSDFVCQAIRSLPEHRGCSDARRGMESHGRTCLAASRTPCESAEGVRIMRNRRMALKASVPLLTASVAVWLTLPASLCQGATPAAWWRSPPPLRRRRAPGSSPRRAGRRSAARSPRRDQARRLPSAPKR